MNGRDELKRPTMTMVGLLALAVPAAAAADHQPDHKGPVKPPALITKGCGIEPAKMSIERVRIEPQGSLLDVLAPITARASGTVDVSLSAARQNTVFSVPVDAAKARIRFTRPIPAAQARLETGIVTLNYKGDPDTRPQVVRLRAAEHPANLEMQRPQVDGGRVKAEGTVSQRSRGVVRVQLQWLDQACATQTIEMLARIDNGRWKLDQALTDAQRQGLQTRRGSVHSYTLFTGYFPERVRGEMRSFQVMGGRN